MASLRLSGISFLALISGGAFTQATQVELLPTTHQFYGWQVGILFPPHAKSLERIVFMFGLPVC